MGGQRSNPHKLCPKYPVFGLIAINSTKTVTILGLSPKKSFISPALSAHTCTLLHKEKNNSILTLGTAAHSLALSITSQKTDCSTIVHGNRNIYIECYCIVINILKLHI